MLGWRHAPILSYLRREEEEGGYRMGRTPRRRPQGDHARNTLLKQHTVSGTWQDSSHEPAKE